MYSINHLLRNFANLNIPKLNVLDIRQINVSAVLATAKLNRTPYPWKNYSRQDPKYQYTSKIEDSDLTAENKEALMEERLQWMQALDLGRLQVLKQSEWPRNEFRLGDTQRCGLIGFKLGLIPHWDTKGRRIVSTLYQIMDNVALNYIPPIDVENLFRSSRYYMKFHTDFPSWVTQRRWGLQFVGAVAADPGEFTSAYSGLFTKYGVTPRRKFARFLVSEDAAIEPGTDLSIQHFRLGDFIDVTARTTNHGFEGVMIRHGFKGGPKAHGCTKFHRRPGAISHGVDVLRGKKMPGVRGNRLRSVRGLQIIRMDYKYNILYLNGLTPGPIHSYAYLCDTWLKYRMHERTASPAMPTIYETDEEYVDWTQRHDDDYLDIIHKFDDPTITYS